MTFTDTPPSSVNQLLMTCEPGAIPPVRSHPTDAGLDLHAYGTYTLTPDDHSEGALPVTPTLVDTGISAAIPPGRVGILVARSSLAGKFNGARLRNGVGIIDSDYRGTIKANIQVDRHTVIPNGSRIVQLLIMPIDLPLPIIVSRLPETARNQGGFGSTGN